MRHPAARPALWTAWLLIVAGCAALPGPTAFVQRPDLVRLDEVDVRLVDSTGLAEAVLPIPASMPGPFQGGIERIPGQPRDLVIPWVGGDCDVETTLTLGREGDELVLSVDSRSEPPASGVLCTLGGRLRAVLLRFRDTAPAIRLEGD